MRGSRAKVKCFFRRAAFRGAAAVPEAVFRGVFRKFAESASVFSFSAKKCLTFCGASHIINRARLTEWVKAMLLGLSRIIGCPGGVVPFEMSLDLSGETFGGCRPVTEPVRCSGQVRNTAGVLVLTGTLSTTLHGVCDRCAAEFERDVAFPVEAVLVRELANEEEADPWMFVLDGDHADLDEIMTTAFVLSMDTKLLCSEDCRGLCPACGKNLNEGPCGCRPEPDPRFAVLKQLLK